MFLGLKLVFGGSKVVRFETNALVYISQPKRRGANPRQNERIAQKTFNIFVKNGLPKFLLSALRGSGVPTGRAKRHTSKKNQFSAGFAMKSFPGSLSGFFNLFEKVSLPYVMQFKKFNMYSTYL